MSKVYRVEVSRLTDGQKLEVKEKLQTKCPLVLERDPIGSFSLLWAFDVIESTPGDFVPPDDFKAALGLPEQCTVTDITGQDLHHVSNRNSKYG